MPCKGASEVSECSMGEISSMDTISTSQILDSPPTDDTEASAALTREEDVDKD